MSLAEVTFKPTNAMPSYQGTCAVVDPNTGKSKKPLIVITKPGKYFLPEEKVAQICHDFPDNFISTDVLDWSKFQIAGGTIHLEPGEGVPELKKAAGAPSHNRAAQPPGRDR